MMFHLMNRTSTHAVRTSSGYQTVGIWLALLLAVVVPAGCDRDESGSSNGGGGQGGAKLQEVRLGYFANLTHAQAVLGVSSGQFQQAVEPAKLTTKVFNAGPSLVEALFAGEIDIGYIGPGPVLAAHAQSRGKGVRVIAGGAANGVLIVARKDSGIKALPDLAGRKLATPQQGNTQDIAARHYLTAELKQKDPSGIKPIANAEQAGLMARGEIDASWAPEPWGSYLMSEAGATLVAEEKDLWPQKRFATVVVITTPEFLEKHPEVVKKFLAVHRDWTDRLTADPDKHVPRLGDALFALTKKRLPPGVLESSLSHTEFTTDPLEHTFTTFAVWSYDLGFAKQPIDVKGLIDTTVLQSLPAPAGAAPAAGGATGETSDAPQPAESGAGAK